VLRPPSIYVRKVLFNRGTLEVSFRNTRQGIVTCAYPGAGYADFKFIGYSPSPGSTVDAFYRHFPYVVLPALL
jgi:hypothetical protein